MQRRLAAILSADVAGYSRLMAGDEAATVTALTERRTIFDRVVAAHRGRIVDMAGDSVLADFASVVDGLNAAVEIQRDLAVLNEPLPPAKRMVFRIGVNVGDVIVDGDRIYGDGVNVAARVQELAEPGGVAVSGTAYDQAHTKVALAFESRGEHAVKNIADPIRVYRIVASVSMPGAAQSRDYPEVPDTPSIAVLPFVNMSGNPDEDYFADGIAEDIITALSKLSKLFVVARTSTFTYKGRQVPVPQIAKEQGVRYVLEGSVRRAGSRLRLTAQLIDGRTGRHLWAERYDRPLDDVFAVQDELTRSVVTELQVHLTEGEGARLMNRLTTNTEAYDHFLRGRAAVDRFGREDNAEALRHAERAIALDPGFAGAWMLLGWTYWTEARLGSPSAETARTRAREAATRSLALDETIPGTHALLAGISLFERKFDDALRSAQRGYDLGSHAPSTVAILATVLTCVNRTDEAIRVLRFAMRHSPVPPAYYWLVLGIAYFVAGQRDEAVHSLRTACDAMPNSPIPPTFLALALSRLDRDDDGRHAVVEARRRHPAWSIDQFLVMPYRGDDVAGDVAILRRLGLP